MLATAAAHPGRRAQRSMTRARRKREAGLAKRRPGRGLLLSPQRRVRPYRIHPCVPASQSGDPVCRGVARDAGGGRRHRHERVHRRRTYGCPSRRGRHSPADASRCTDVRHGSWAAETEVLFDAGRSFARRSIDAIGGPLSGGSGMVLARRRSLSREANAPTSVAMVVNVRRGSARSSAEVRRRGI